MADTTEVAPKDASTPRKKTIGSRLVSHMIHEEFHTWDFKTRADFIKTEVLLGITICFAQIPESVAFAFMAHIKPPVALHAAWVVGLICTVLGGRSGMVNGAEGAFAAIIAGLVAEPTVNGGNGEGIELLFPSVMCGGVLMLVVWLLRLDRFVTMLPVRRVERAPRPAAAPPTRHAPRATGARDDRLLQRPGDCHRPLTAARVPFASVRRGRAGAGRRRRRGGGGGGGAKGAGGRWR